LTSFEIWCENLLIKKIQPQKYNQFTIGPLAAYLIARENEIKTVRMILQGKLNQLPEEAIRERLRIMYV
jgi:V/A-type H+-transporting ATPase subunit C